MQHSSVKNRGFTLVELIISITVMAILTAIVFGTLDDFYTANTASLNKTTLDTNTQSALRRIEDSVSKSTEFLDTSSVPNPLGPSNTGTTGTETWSYNSDPSGQGNMVLITKNVATTTANDLVFSNTNNTGCNPTSELPLDTVLLYFVNRDSRTGQYNLYRRTVVNPSGQPVCTTAPAQRTSCAAGAPSSSLCQGIDAVLLYNVTGFQLTFYTDTGTVTTLPSSAATVQIAIESKSTNGNIIPSSASIRINKLSL